jgi:hypothetical protein
MMKKPADRHEVLPGDASPAGRDDVVTSNVVVEDLKGESAEWGGGSSGLNA